MSQSLKKKISDEKSATIREKIREKNCTFSHKKYLRCWNHDYIQPDRHIACPEFSNSFFLNEWFERKIREKWILPLYYKKIQTLKKSSLYSAQQTFRVSWFFKISFLNGKCTTIREKIRKTCNLPQFDKKKYLRLRNHDYIQAVRHKIKDIIFKSIIWDTLSIDRQKQVIDK